MLSPFKIPNSLNCAKFWQQKRLITKVLCKDLLRIIHFGIHHLIVPFFWGNFLNFPSSGTKNFGNGMKTATNQPTNQQKKTNIKNLSRREINWNGIHWFFFSSRDSTEHRRWYDQKEYNKKKRKSEQWMRNEERGIGSRAKAKTMNGKHYSSLK